MRKVFLYLYPIEEYMSAEIKNFDDLSKKLSMITLNRTIEKRYRSQGYDVVFAKFKNRDIYNLEVKENDTVINTDVDYDREEFMYPDPEYLINQIGEFDQLVIGGFHSNYCVKRVGRYCYDDLKIKNTTVDLELTENFFSIFDKPAYFDINKYDNNKVVDYVIKNKCNSWFAKNKLYSDYNHLIYNIEQPTIKKDLS